MSWMIDKQFSFCYGHRVWSQELNEEFCQTGDTQCKCRFTHGHEGLIHVFLEGDELTRGMVTDFKHLGWMKNFLDDNLDHKFILDRNDPIFSTIINGDIIALMGMDPNSHAFQPDCFAAEGRFLDMIPVKVPGTETVVGYVLDVENTTTELSGPLKEFYEGFFIVDFLPTSENLSKYLYDIAKEKMSKIDVNVTRVDWWETPKSRSSYSE